LKTVEAFLKLISSNEQMKKLLPDHKDEIKFHGTTAANSSKLTEVSGEHWAAIGDAALSFDPLSSQGMFNAMASAMQLSSLIKDHGFNSVTSTSYQAQTEQIWSHYLNHRNLFYRAETRWDTPFWTRRL